jgi:GldM C-terminal domain
MKNIFQLLFLLFLFQNSFAQSTIANEKNNVLYMGVENPINVVVPDTPPQEVEVKITNGSIKKKDDYLYIANVDKGTTTTIEIWHKGKKKEEQTFRIKKIPDPVAMLNTDQVLPKTENNELIVGSWFRQYGGLKAVLKEFDFEVDCQITSYRIVLAPKKQDPIVCINKGSFFTNECLNILTRIKPGDVVFLDLIKSKCKSDLSERNLNTIKILIK